MQPIIDWLTLLAFVLGIGLFLTLAAMISHGSSYGDCRRAAVELGMDPETGCAHLRQKSPPETGGLD